MIVLDIRPYWSNIVEYYWDNLDPSIDGTIWEWLRRNYEVHRTFGNYKHNEPMNVTFQSDKQLTMFLLRWTYA